MSTDSPIIFLLISVYKFSSHGSSEEKNLISLTKVNIVEADAVLAFAQSLASTSNLVSFFSPVPNVIFFLTSSAIVFHSNLCKRAL